MRQRDDQRRIKNMSPRHEIILPCSEQVGAGGPFSSAPSKLPSRKVRCNCCCRSSTFWQGAIARHLSPYYHSDSYLLRVTHYPFYLSSTPRKHKSSLVSKKLQYTPHPVSICPLLPTRNSPISTWDLPSLTTKPNFALLLIFTCTLLSKAIYDTSVNILTFFNSSNYQNNSHNG